MPGEYDAPSVGEYAALMDAIDRMQIAIRELEAVDGSQMGSLIAQVQAALANIVSTVSAAIALTSYTKAQIDARVTNPGLVGNVSSSGTIASAGQVQGNTGKFDGGLFSVDARNFVVVTNYAASWIDVNGHFGISPSTVRYKKDIQDWADEDVEKLLSIRPKKFRLRIPEQQIPVLDEDGNQRRDQTVTPAEGPWTEDGRAPVFIDDNGAYQWNIIPAYEDAEDAPLRIGFLAEDLCEAGFDEAVVFDSEGRPVSINYAEWVVPLQMTVRWLRDRQEEDRKTIEEQGRLIAELSSRMDALDGGV